MERIIVIVKIIENALALKAQVDITFPLPGGEITISKFKLVETKNGFWLAPPCEAYSGKDGKKKYAPIVEMPRGYQKQLQELVVSKYEEELARLKK